MKILFLGLLLPVVAHAGARESPIVRLPPIGDKLTTAFHSAPPHAWPVIVQFLRTDNHDAATYKALDAAFQPTAQLHPPLPAVEYAPTVSDFSNEVGQGHPPTVFVAQQKLHELSTHMQTMIPPWQVVSSYNESLQAPNSEHARILMESTLRIARQWLTDQVVDETLMTPFSFAYPAAKNDLPALVAHHDNIGGRVFRVQYMPWNLSPNDPLLKILGPRSFEYGFKHILSVRSDADHYDIELMGAPGDANRYDHGPTLRVFLTTGEIKILPSRVRMSSEILPDVFNERRGLWNWLASLEFGTWAPTKPDKIGR